ncbi:unnamed protein product, partial [Staurois parvus]
PFTVARLSITVSQLVITHLRPVITEDPALFTNSPPPCRLGHTALDDCTQHSHSEQHAYSEAPNTPPPSKTLPAHS